MLKIKIFRLGPLEQQPLVVYDDHSREGFLIDPGTQDPSIEKYIYNNKILLKAVLNTHAHLDHIGGVVFYQDLFDLPFYLHEREQIILDDCKERAKYYGLPVPRVPIIENKLYEGALFSMGSLTFRCIETPGHTPGGVCFYGEDFLLSGDTLFAGSVGRTDLLGGDDLTLLRSLNKLKNLKGETIVYPGHGERTTIAHEIKTNPFFTR